jgi:hypothetical protein
VAAVGVEGGLEEEATMLMAMSKSLSRLPWKQQWADEDVGRFCCRPCSAKPGQGPLPALQLRVERYSREIAGRGQTAGAASNLKCSLKQKRAYTLLT